MIADKRNYKNNIANTNKYKSTYCGPKCKAGINCSIICSNWHEELFLHTTWNTEDEEDIIDDVDPSSMLQKLLDTEESDVEETSSLLQQFMTIGESDVELRLIGIPLDHLQRIFAYIPQFATIKPQYLENNSS